MQLFSQKLFFKGAALKKYLKIGLVLFKLVVTILFVGFVYASVEDAQELLSYITPQMLLVGVATSLLMQWLHIYRWKQALILEGSQFTLMQLSQSYFIGSLLGIISPGRVGELLRFYYLPNLSRKRGFLAILIDRLTFMASLSVLALLFLSTVDFTLFTLTKDLSITPSVLKAVLWISGLLAGIGLLIGLSVVKKKVNESGSLRAYILLVLSSFTVSAILVIQTALLFSLSLSTGIYKGIIMGLGTFSFMQLSPITIGNMGTRELFLMYFYTMTNELTFSPRLQLPEILAISLTIVAVNLLLPALIGFVFMVKELVGRKSIKN